MWKNLPEFYRKSDGATKKKILSKIFADKLVLGKGKVINLALTESIQLILSISKVLGSSEKKKEVEIKQSLVVTLSKNHIFRIYKLQTSVRKCECETES